MSQISSMISGVGSYLPERVVTNEELTKTVDTTDAWIVERTGITQRYIVADDQSTSDLAIAAAKEAIDNAHLTSDDIDLIVVATTSADHTFPAVATQVQLELGCRQIPAFDIQAVCAGFIYALATVDNFIRAGQAKHALVIGAETFTRLLNWEDRSTCVLFGDGAGAFVLSATEGQPSGLISTHLYSDGRHKDLLWVPQGAGATAIEAELGPYVHMKGKDVFKVAVKELGNAVETTLAANGFSSDDLDWLIPHQANIRILEAVAKRIDLPSEKVVVTVDQHANTSSASVPLAFHTALKDGRIQRGDLCLLEAFGGGFVWGSALLRY